MPTRSLIEFMFAFGGLLPASCMLCDSRFCIYMSKTERNTCYNKCFVQNQLEVHCRNIHSRCHPPSVLLADTVMLVLYRFCMFTKVKQVVGGRFASSSFQQCNGVLLNTSQSEIYIVYVGRPVRYSGTGVLLNTILG
jgi:hypothetical protein